MRRAALLALVLCAALAVPAAGGGRNVKIGDDYYRARKISVRAGSTVTWRWAGRRRHDVYFTRAPRRAKPKRCKPRRKGSCTRRIRRRGTYRYVCTIHGSMAGRIVAR